METSELATVSLDDIPDAQGCDYLKVDAQGAEGLILSAAQGSLRSVLVVQTEMMFLPIYERQPLFGDIDAILRSFGFAFHRFHGTVVLSGNAPAGM